MDNNEELISVIEGQFEKHLFFHGVVSRQAAFNICTNLTGIVIGIKQESDSEFICEGPEQSITTLGQNKKIVLHLNSPGGSIVNAFMIADLIETLDIPVDCIVEGNLASAGIIILLACTNRTMQKHSKLYFHETVHAIDSISYDRLNDFKKESVELNEAVKNYYLEKTKLTPKELNRILKTEAVYTYEDALSHGFITY